MRLLAYAKVNLALEVGHRRPDGLHDLRGLFLSVDLADEILLEPAEEDRLVVAGGAPADPASNLAWRALEAARRSTGDPTRWRLELTKRIPTKAGLGGGSADAAAVLGALAGDLPAHEVAAVAVELGADVPFALVGGFARVAGIGEVVEPLPPVGGFALAVVVPPVELATGAVFRRFDELGGRGPEIPAWALPPALRDHAPLRNDLYGAACSLAPELDDWRRELEGRWGTPVAMTGSGAGLFAYFPTRDEAAAAVTEIPAGARFAEACEPVERGWIAASETER
ncbi:MAG TPA: 4-(cytidine 5'-diphospho)-2-C-methyl-D-erythritol kinase [Actinobacteria bacterium]|nr:4-(cytidine 5'-diphospho)-2-C-methyl-D-erythritol kinase [Actinomycetota bacterium]